MDVLGRMENESIDLIVTDPPYRITHRGSTTCGGIFDMPDAQSGKLFKYNDIPFAEWLPEVYRVLKNGSHAYIMTNALNLKDMQTDAENAGFRFQNLLVWDKANVTPNKYYMQQCEFILMLRKGQARNINDCGQSNLLRIPNEVGKKDHPTQKPINLMQVFIEQSSNKGDIVLDPFMGAGSTALAAIRAGRNYIGTEIDPQYHSIALKRLQIEQQYKQQNLFDGI